MRKDGGGYGDHDRDPSPIGSTIFAAVAILVLVWIGAGAPRFGLF